MVVFYDAGFGQWWCYGGLIDKHRPSCRERSPVQLPHYHALFADALLLDDRTEPSLEPRDGSLLKAAIKRTAGGRDTPTAISFETDSSDFPKHTPSAYTSTPL
ncbi:hypothetical protein [Haladaptatus sp. NG-SE-30]